MVRPSSETLDSLRNLVLFRYDESALSVSGNTRAGRPGYSSFAKAPSSSTGGPPVGLHLGRPSRLLSSNREVIHGLFLII
jgi:hypothetical protein